MFLGGFSRRGVFQQSRWAFCELGYSNSPEQVTKRMNNHNISIVIFQISLFIAFFHEQVTSSILGLAILVTDLHLCRAVKQGVAEYLGKIGL